MRIYIDNGACDVDASLERIVAWLQEWTLQWCGLQQGRTGEQECGIQIRLIRKPKVVRASDREQADSHPHHEHHLRWRHQATLLRRHRQPSQRSLHRQASRQANSLRSILQAPDPPRPVPSRSRQYHLRYLQADESHQKQASQMNHFISLFIYSINISHITYGILYKYININRHVIHIYIIII